MTQIQLTDDARLDEIQDMYEKYRHIIRSIEL